MSRYPSCEKLGLKVNQMNDSIKASEVERLLSEGVEVFGNDSEMENGLGPDRSTFDAFSGLLIGYKPIEKEQPVSVTKEKLAAAWNKMTESSLLKTSDESPAFKTLVKELGL